MYRFKLKLNLMETIAAVRQGSKWEHNVAIRMPDSKEKAKEGDLAEQTHIRCTQMDLASRAT